MSLKENEHFEESKREAEQEAPITLSRRSLENLEDAYWTLSPSEIHQVEEALKAMQVNDDYEPLKQVYRKHGGLSMVD
jgi:hypothetical protein